MPVKTRRSKKREAPADAIALLLAGKYVPFSDENREALIERVYLTQPRLPPSVETRASEILREWREGKGETTCR